MVKNIMVTTDFSDCGNTAIGFSFDLARQLKAKVTLLNVIEREQHDSPSYIDLKPLDSKEHSKKAMRQAKKDLESLLTEKITGDVRFEIEVVIDRIADDGIIATVEKLKPDMLVMASHGYSGFKKLLLGSTTDHILKSVDCPVVVIKAEDKEKS